MMVTFVSQCEKNALKKTRRVLDSFADRIGDKTWQTLITNEGLNAVKKLLRKTASKNTAVSCFWVRSHSRSELVWIVGNRQKFNNEGVVPVNSTQKSFQNYESQLDWHYLPLIKCLTALAALFHDWGKASVCFQEKLKPNSKNSRKGDPWRHEWISTLLLNAFVNGEADEQWLARLAKGEISEEMLIKTVEKKNIKPLTQLPEAASLIAWLVVSHHKLPLPKTKDEQNKNRDSPIDLCRLLDLITVDFGFENKFSGDEKDFNARLKQCLEFPEGLPSRSKPWLKQIRKWAAKMEVELPTLKQVIKDGSWRVVLHHARLSLMLGDHHYSSQDADKTWQSDYGPIANTYSQDQYDPKSKKKIIGKKDHAKQKLDEHLVGVAKAALKTAHLLPAFEEELPFAQDIKLLKKKSKAPFQWQDKAVDKIKKWKQSLSEKYNDKPFGFFVVNMASTGCGKTFANAKVMRILSKDSESLRFILALGLRSLTLQTGDEYRNRIGLDNSELAVLIGSKAVLELHNQNKIETPSEESLSESAGSESSQTLLDDEMVDYECAIPEGGLNTILTTERDRKFLWAPVLACTIDHLMSATETKRGGRYILPSLRLMSSDLVIDEVDDFQGEDLIAIGRLVHLAGMLGRKVMISSATIPPDLAEGYFNAYREGWQLFAKTRAVSSSLGCAWIDESRTHVETLTELETIPAVEQYQKHHQDFVKKRISELQAIDFKKRRAEIVVCEHLKQQEKQDRDAPQTIQEAYFDIIKQAILSQHDAHHQIDPNTKKRVSFGVVRMANIVPCVALTEYLALAEWREDVEIRVMAYHSQQVLLMRSEQEKYLDKVLKRKQPDAVFENDTIKRHLHEINTSNVIFILVATPVEEVGRDHDFDWAVVEPSSYRSFIQLAGRVLRHRTIDVSLTSANMSLLQYNLRGLTTTETPAFCMPGYESTKNLLNTHDLKQLIDEKRVNESIDAIPRIQRNEELDQEKKLIDLEHFTISKLLNNYSKKGPETMQGWLTQSWWMTALPQIFNRFREGVPQLKLYLVPKDDKLIFMQKDDDGKLQKAETFYRIKHHEMEPEALKRIWLDRDYLELLESFADENISLQYAAQRYGEIALPLYGDGSSQTEYRYSPQLGLSRLAKN